jgi:hypothetical protein
MVQALAMNEGQRRKKKLWSEQGRAQLAKLPLATCASRRRQDLLELLDRMNPTSRRVRRRSAHKKYLTEPTLLEMN